MKRIGIVSTLVLVALLAVGVGLARWSDQVNIEGEVHTGSLSAAIASVMCSDTETAGKDYSSISAAVDPNDPRTLLVTVENGYPGIVYTCQFNLLNTGTIPLHVDGVTVEGLPGHMAVEVTGLPVDTQVHPEAHATGTLTVTLDGTVSESATSTFTVTVDVGQWNLDPSP